MVDADGRLLVALAGFLDAVLAKRDVEVRHQPRPPLIVAKYVKPRAARVDHQDVLLPGMQLQHVARQPVLGRARAHRPQARQRLFAQAFDAVLRHRLDDVAEGQQRPRARQQQVAAHQVREAEVGIVAEQRVDALQRLVDAVRLDRFEHRRQAVFRGRGRCRDGESQRRQGKQNSPHLPAFSSRICQRPSAFTSSRVLVFELVSLSER